jgi:hypothetical protein
VRARGWAGDCSRELASAAASLTLARGERAHGRHAAEILAPLDLDDHGIVEGERLRGRPGEIFFAVPFEPDFDDLDQQMNSLLA